jgi:hypothetical protein
MFKKYYVTGDLIINIEEISRVRTYSVFSYTAISGLKLSGHKKISGKTYERLCDNSENVIRGKFIGSKSTSTEILLERVAFLLDKKDHNELISKLRLVW